MAGPSGLSVSPAAGVDPSKPADTAVVSSRVDAGGHTQVRVVVTPTKAADPSDPKPEVKPEAKVEDKPADAPAAAPEAAPRPSWLPEKFATPNALKDATIELAKKQGAPAYVIRGLEASESGQEVSDAYKSFEKSIDPNAGKPVEKVEEKPKEDPVVEKPAPTVQKTDADKAYEVETYGSYVATMLDTVGIRAVDMAEEFAQNGNKLTAATYEKFAKAGVTKGFLDSYIAGMVGNARNLAEQSIAEVKASVGGDAEFGKLATWASGNLSKEQHETYTIMTNSGSVVAAKQAVKMLKGWYDDANGKPPTLVKQAVPETKEAPKGYGSNQEMMKDMSSPAYKSGDKAFHRMVEEKLKNTKNL